MSDIIPINDVQKMATSAAKSGMFPVKSIDQAMTLMMIAQSENIHPMAALMQYDVIQGRPSLKSTEVLARFQKSGGQIEWLETNEKTAKAKFTHEKGGTITIEWTMDRAVKAGLTNKDNWKKFPDQMLRARVVTEGVRAIYPACLNNMYSSDEVRDFVETEVETKSEKKEPEELNIRILKMRLSDKLMALGIRKSDIKEFAEMFNLGENEELVKELTEDDLLLSDHVLQFENKDK